MQATPATFPGTILVSGGASGLGAAIVACLRKEGARVVSLDRRSSGDDDAIVVDVANADEVEAAVHSVAERDGALAGIVTAAGTDVCGRLTDVSRDEWERVVRVNLLGTAALVRAAVPWLERTHGRIVTVASTLGLRALSDASAYCASKFGVVGFTRALTAELAGRVGVTLLIPGGMRTAFFDDRPEQYRPGPDADLMNPDDVARCVHFALTQPAGCQIREMLVCSSKESSWP
jgi:NAD(P)-dependent dehydrogenase (short-subunit alcohol dehydrogenase family)